MKMLIAINVNAYCDFLFNVFKFFLFPWHFKSLLSDAMMLFYLFILVKNKKMV